MTALLHDLPPPPESAATQPASRGVRKDQTSLQLLIANALQTQFEDQSNNRTAGASREAVWDGSSLVVGGFPWPSTEYQPQLVIDSSQAQPALQEPRSAIPARTVEEVHIRSPTRGKAPALGAPTAHLAPSAIDVSAPAERRRNTAVSAQMLDSLGDGTERFSPRGVVSFVPAMQTNNDAPQRSSRPRDLTAESPQLHGGAVMKDLLFGDGHLDEQPKRPVSQRERASVPVAPVSFALNPSGPRQAPVAWVVSDVPAVDAAAKNPSRLSSPRPPLSHQSPRPLPGEANAVVSSSKQVKGVPFSDVYVVEEKESPDKTEVTSCVDLQPTVVFHSPNCPLRSVSLVHDTKPDLSSESRSYSATFAIGSNAKSVHLFKYEGAKPTRGAVGGTESSDAIFALNEFVDVHKGSVYTTDWYCPDYNSSSLALGIVASGSNDKSIRLIRYPFMFDRVIAFWK